MRTKTHSQADTAAATVKDIRRAYDALDVFNNHSWTNHRDALFDLCRAEEKEHRGFMPDFAKSHTTDTISLTDAARLFVVHRLAEYLTGTKMPTVADYLHTQKSCFYAAALVSEFRGEIEKAWAGFDVNKFAALNYTDFVKVKRD